MYLESLGLHTRVYFGKISYGWSSVIKLHCGKNHSQIGATELDLWPLIVATRQPWQKINLIFEVDDSRYSHYLSLTVPKHC